MSNDDVTLSSETWQVDVSPHHGGRLSRLAMNGIDVLVENTQRLAKDALLWGCYPMVPWAGRLRRGQFDFNGRAHNVPVNEYPHAIHGFGFASEWAIDEVDDTHVVMSLDLSRHSPFDGTCTHVVALDDAAVNLVLEVHTTANPFPAMVGWHPWFTRAWSYDVSFATMLARDNDNIVSTSETAPREEPWDDCFVNPRAVPRVFNDTYAVFLESDCSHWMMYTEPQHAFCIEPMSGPPNSLDESHPSHVVVSPAAPLRRSLSFVARTRAPHP